MKLENQIISKLLQTENKQIKKEKVQLELNTWARKLKKKNQEELSDESMSYSSSRNHYMNMFPKTVMKRTGLLDHL